MTEPFIAGSFDLQQTTATARSALAAALEDDEPVHTDGHGPLAVAAHRALLARSGPVIVALEGALYDLPARARELGLDPGAPAARVLHAAWRCDGDAFLEQLRGDFALLLWDTERRRGLIARDQLGNRGLVWSRQGDRLVFASEVRQLLRLLDRTPDPDGAALGHWLAVSGMPGDRTLFDHIRRVQAAHLLELGDRAASTRRYWRPAYRAPLRAPREEIVERIREALGAAVKRRLPEAGAAVMLSGGLDSASVAALGSHDRLGARRLGRAYSATFPDHPSVDEAALIGRLCDAFGLSGVQAVVRGGSVISGALSYLDRWRLPPVSPNLFFWNPLLGRAAAEGVTVMLDGEGGDELFGLSPTLIADRVRHGRLRAARHLITRIPGGHGRPSRSSVRRVMREYGWKAATPLPVHRAIRRIRGHESYGPDWLRPETARSYAETDDRAEWKRTRGPRWFAHLRTATTSGMGPALTYDHVRRRAATVGIEPRHPIMDVDVVELVLQVPPEMAYDAHLSRPLLREAMAGLMPDEVRLRPSKSTFDAVFHQALGGPDLPVVRELLSDKEAALGAYVDLRAVHERLLARQPPTDPGARMEWALQTWRLVTAECWLRTAADPGFPAHLAANGGLRPPDCVLVERAAGTR